MEPHGALSFSGRRFSSEATNAVFRQDSISCSRFVAQDGVRAFDLSLQSCRNSTFVCVEKLDQLSSVTSCGVDFPNAARRPPELQSDAFFVQKALESSQQWFVSTQRDFCVKVPSDEGVANRAVSVDGSCPERAAAVQAKSRDAVGFVLRHAVLLKAIDELFRSYAEGCRSTWLQRGSSNLPFSVSQFADRVCTSEKASEFLQMISVSLGKIHCKASCTESVVENASVSKKETDPSRTCRCDLVENGLVQSAAARAAFGHTATLTHEVRPC